MRESIFSGDAPVAFTAGRISAMLETVGTRERWTVEYVSDAAMADVRGTAVPIPDTVVTGVPRHLTTDTFPGTLWSPVRDRDTVPLLRLSGVFESFVPVDRIRTITRDGAE